MSAQTIEKVRKAETALKQKVAAAGDELSPEKRRALKKSLRRSQRKRRRMDAIVAKHAPKPKAAEGDGGEG